MAPTKHMVNWGDRRTGGHLNKESEVAADHGFHPSGHYRKQLPTADVVVIGDHTDIDFRPPLGEIAMFVSNKDNVVEFSGPPLGDDRYNEQIVRLVGARGLGVWNTSPGLGYDQRKGYAPYSPGHIRIYNRQEFGRIASEERITEPVRRNERVEAKDGIYFSWAIDEAVPEWKGTGIRKSSDYLISEIELQEAFRFALDNVIVAYPVAPEPKLSPSHAIMQIAIHPAADELVITPSESLDTNQSIAGEGDRVVREREKLFVGLANAFDAVPFEDGIAHPAEKIIEYALGMEVSFNWLLELVNESSYQSTVPSVLRCLGRMVEVGTDSWRVNLVSDALASNEAEVRDAAVQLVESWAGNDLLTVLESHNEPVPWIRDYINDVLADLGE